MKIKLVKINRHKWFPFINKEVILSITPDLPIKNDFVISGTTRKGEKIESNISVQEQSYIQPMCNNWEIIIKDGKADISL